MWKHGRFEDSAVMRSLEKLSKDKDFVKTASKDIIKKADLSPSESLTDNIIKLCNGLRKSGFAKHADDLETNFINYKKADTSLYGITGETGEDLVDAAHPDGSHRLEGVDGDSLVETIVDNQIAHLKIVDKMPTGKLTNAKKIINAVKMVLGAGEDVEVLRREMLDKLDFINKKVTAIHNIADKQLSSLAPIVGYFPLSTITRTIKSNIKEPTYENLDNAKKNLVTLRHRLDPDTIMPGGVHIGSWDNIKLALDECDGAINVAIKNFNIIEKNDAEKELAETPTAQKPAIVPQTTLDKSQVKYIIQNNLIHLDSIIESVDRQNWNQSKKDSALKWANDQKSVLQ